VIIVLAAGPLATIQDLGRPGFAALGVSPSGAADRAALRRANRLVGNPEGAAAIEATMGGLELRFQQPTVIALTGAPAPALIGGREVAANSSTRVAADDVLRLARPHRGLRTYLAIRGGIDAPLVLGSRSRDVLGQLGPAPLRAGDHLAIAAPTLALPDTDIAPVAALLPDLMVRVRPGPRADWFTESARSALLNRRWYVSHELDRIAIRLIGPKLIRCRDGEVPSEGLVRGAVQVPASGQPLIFLADHPTTGGYPVIAVVDDADTDALAQLRPGQTLRLRTSQPRW
jgi:biotin-dependent carboxylase-like uncharacterized protein